MPGGALGITNTTATGNAGIAQNLRWGGGGVRVDAEQQQTGDQQHDVDAESRVQHDVFWRNTRSRFCAVSRSTTTRQSIVVTKLNQDISKSSCRRSIINTLSNVRNAYWDYVFAIQAVDVAQRSLDLAEQLVQDNQTRVEVGTMAPIDVVQAQSNRRRAAADAGARRKRRAGPRSSR